jgi:hypothetical protein
MVFQEEVVARGFLVRTVVQSHDLAGVVYPVGKGFEDSERASKVSKTLTDEPGTSSVVKL